MVYKGTQVAKPQALSRVWSEKKSDAAFNLQHY